MLLAVGKVTKSFPILLPEDRQYVLNRFHRVERRKAERYKVFVLGQELEEFKLEFDQIICVGFCNLLSEFEELGVDER